jgi:hypothetical protein
MPQPTESYKQFNYSLRPSKQVERKIMVEVLLRFATAEYHISGYKYWGFGSPYYVDFVLFHKYLFIEKMVCVEWGDVARRMRFNKPFKFIRLKLGALSKHIPSIQRKEKLLVWLDYDRALDPDMLQDIDGMVGRLAPGSIFIVTIDARPKLSCDLLEEADDKSPMGIELFTLLIYNQWFGEYVGDQIELGTVASANVTRLFHSVVSERIRKTLTRRGEELQFIQTFYYLYQDGAPMLTVGGMIGTSKDRSRLKDAGVLDHRFVRTDANYLEIAVPPLTFREKQWLDCRLDDKLTIDRLRFELDDKFLQSYRMFYKEYPSYFETLL